jgi:hypothetical protein
MTKDEIIKALRDMAKYPTVTLPRDCEALRMAADLLAQPAQQEPFQPDWANFEEGRKVGRAEALERPPNCGTSYCSCIECVMKPA